MSIVECGIGISAARLRRRSGGPRVRGDAEGMLEALLTVCVVWRWFSGRDEIAAAFPASMNDHDQSFTTTGFFIRYCDEEVRLHDVAHFRLELDASRDPPDIDSPRLEPVLVKFELLYASFKGSRRALPAIVADPDAFSVSSSHEFRINDLHRGIHEVSDLIPGRCNLLVYKMV